jgi:flagellar hook assembly protein FlgD
VATLAKGTHAAGYHSVGWSGRSDNGATVSGGVYFYRLDTPGFNATRRMVYVR